MLGLLVFTLLLASFAFSDISAPKTTPETEKDGSIETEMGIWVDYSVKEPTLVIPREQLQRLLEETSNSSAANISSQNGISRTQTIVAGVFLSLAMLAGGIVITRSKKVNSKTAKTIVAGMVLIGAGTTATIIFANVGPPPVKLGINNKMFYQKEGTTRFRISDKIKLKVDENNDQNIRLYVPVVREEKKNNKEE